MQRTWHRSVLLVFVFVSALTWHVENGRSAAPPADDQAIARIRGVYLYSEHPENTSDMAALQQALPTPGIDGLAVLIGWSNIEPHRGTFHWDLFDTLVRMAVSSNRKIDLAIRAGQDTPTWLFDVAGATQLHFKVSPLEGDANSNCNDVYIAPPWDPVFLSEWQTLLAAVSQHLKDIGAYDQVIAVRLTGVNRTTAELRLPAEILTSPCTTNSVKIWLDAGYNESLLLQAWGTITDAFQQNFPDKIFTLPIIPSASGNGNREYPFPAIDDAGCPYQPPWPQPGDPNYSKPPCTADTNSFPGQFPPVPDQNAKLLKMTSEKFPGRLVVAYQNLDLRMPAQPYVVYAAETWGTFTGFQTNDYIGFQRAACSTPGDFQNPCADSAAYLDLLEIGIYPCRTNAALCAGATLKSQYIEVLAPDVLSFPDAIQKAHVELHRDANADR